FFFFFRLYRPYRTRNFERLIKEIKPALDVQHKIGILGAAVSDHPQLTELLEHITAKGSRVSVSSLRADCLTEKLVSRVKHGSQQTFTIAPEAGSERLRHVINKNLSTEDILTAVAVLAAAHITNIKLYFMIGLPTETDEDINAIIALTRQIKHQYYSQTKSQKWLNRITLSISPFVPKPFTPFQWHPYERLSTLKQKIKHISRALKRESKVTVYADLPKWGYIQTLLSRGDRRVFQLLQDAHRQGSTWSQTLRAAAVNADYYVYRLRTVDEVLPWDFINHGFSKDDLWQEYRQAVDN
ncbi:MAG: radical SAM protein, partial [Deltaproteobacteria bacterium]|nr:radical SAM protein [Deltaproteobacteria bacterium]